MIETSKHIKWKSLLVAVAMTNPALGPLGSWRILGQAIAKAAKDSCRFTEDNLPQKDTWMNQNLQNFKCLIWTTSFFDATSDVDFWGWTWYKMIIYDHLWSSIWSSMIIYMIIYDHL